ncbi:MAG: hypothetical protein NVSMB64_12270 [Candidatus Velthaea sp.]
MRPEILLGTIGFTRTTAERFFQRLAAARIRTLIDTRLHTGGQLSGFAKTPDLSFFLHAVGGIGYRHVLELAPSPGLLARYRAKDLRWDEYAAAYRIGLAGRRPENLFVADELDGACLLCSEHTADRCHRRIAAEYLRDAFAAQVDIAIVHL